MELDVSVVIPFLNEERFIGRSVEAVLAQEYPEDRYEVIAVDNNSTDRSAEIAGRYPRVKLVSEATPGDFAARNRGVAEARGGIVAFTDADTAPFPDWLASIVASMSDPEVAVLVGGLRFAPESRALEMIAQYEAAKNRYIFSSGVPEIYYGYTCNLAARRELFERLGGFAPVHRNADVLFVRAAVDRLSCSAVRYAPEMRVLRLEVSSVGSYLHKQHVYGRDFGRYRRHASVRALDPGERWRVFGSAVRGARYGPLRAAGLLTLLLAGAASYELGRLRGP